MSLHKIIKMVTIYLEEKERKIVSYEIVFGRKLMGFWLMEIEKTINIFCDFLLVMNKKW